MTFNIQMSAPIFDWSFMGSHGFENTLYKKFLYCCDADPLAAIVRSVFENDCCSVFLTALRVISSRAAISLIGRP